SCFFFQAEDGIRGRNVTGVQTCALPILALTQQRNNARLRVGVPCLTCRRALLRCCVSATGFLRNRKLRGEKPGWRRLSAKRICRSEERRVGKERAERRSRRNEKRERGRG